MQVFLENGMVTYEHADEAAEDLKTRGIPVEYTARRKATSPAERLQQALLWIVVDKHGHGERGKPPRREDVHIRETLTGISNGKVEDTESDLTKLIVTASC
jgi:hypothetical protein